MNEREMLHEWKLEAKLPAAFNSAVWRRIEKKQPVHLIDLLAQWILKHFARPAFAASYVSGAVAIGLVAGHFHASNQLREHESNLEARYVQSVDPYAAAVPR